MMSSPTGTVTIASSPGPFPEIVFVNGSDQRRISLDHVPFTIGRKPDRDLVITDARVSRDHAEIKADGADFVLVDVGSSSGTFVNGEKVQGHKLKYNDWVEFGAKGGRTSFSTPPALTGKY
jgi:phosphoserine phosphatase RsbU/P